jgi:hypothetical protein
MMARAALAVVLLTLAGLCLAETPNSAVMLSFDHTKLPPRTVCDGTVSVTDGDVVGLSGVLFDQGERVDGSAWSCKTQGTREQPGDLRVVRTTKRPKAVVANLVAEPSAQIHIQSELGTATVRLGELQIGKPTALFDGKAHIEPAPPAQLLSTNQTEDDYPSIAATASGHIWVAWQSYDNTDDTILVRRFTGSAWGPAEEISEGRGDYHRPRLAASGRAVWAVWSENSGGNWDLVARFRAGGSWSPTIRLTDNPLNDSHHNLTVTPDGEVWMTWQADRGRSQDIMAARVTEAGLADVVAVTSDDRNDWEPTIAPAPGGGVQVAWDAYDGHTYDVRTCRIVGGRVTQRRALASSGDYEAHASVAFTRDGRLWAAWDNGGPEWGRHSRENQRLHGQRSLHLLALDGSTTCQPVSSFQAAIPDALSGHRELPHLAVDGMGRLWMIFRHLVNVPRWDTKTQQPQGQSRGIWGFFAMSYADGEWSSPTFLPHSNGRNDMRVATCVATDGTLWAAWAGDDRQILRAEVPGNHNVYAAPLNAGDTAVELPTEPWQPESEATLAPDPDVPPEPVFLTAGGKDYELLYGDMHRHTDMSRCAMNVDGSLQDTYRYAVDVVKLDFLAISDHDQDILKHRYDRDQRPLQDFMWWRSEKLVDLFHAGPRFVALYGFEHGGSYKVRGGHKNIVYTERGNPCIEDDSPEALFRALEGRDAIAIPHQLADGGSATDWEKWNRQWEPVAEMFQARGSYEYLDAPRMAKVQREGHYLWDALGKGLRVGVIASSDHGLTHGAYAGVYAEGRDRRAILEAIRARRTFGATDKIAMELRLGDRLMGEEVEVDEAPTFHARIIGTGPIRRVDIISDGKFVCTREPAAATDEFDIMLDVAPGETSYFYLRCIQENNEMAWCSPIWVTRSA